MESVSPLDRFRAFVGESGLSHSELADLIGCSQPQITRILKGYRRVQLDVAAGIERITNGDIRAVEWSAERKAS